MKSFGAAITLFLASAHFLAAAPTLDVAVTDRERILQGATAALKQEPISITTFRAKLSEGGPNDFYSNGDYWWPNPNTTNGLPYIQRDGQTNPENFIAHRQAIRQLSDAIAALGAAYRITGDDQYAAKSAALLRVFFLDAQTRMNPSLRFAQAVPGVSSGRGIGIIDTLHLVEIPKAVAAMERSPAFPPEVLTGLKKWFADYVAWMRTSKNGNDEANAGNNHAVAFWLQIAVFAQFTGDETNLAECRRRFTDVFIAKQMTNDGSFPQELRRTKPYGYSIFQLDNMVTLCQVLSTPGNDLWSFTTPDGRSIRKAVEFLYPFLADKSKWPKKPDVQAWADWPARQPSLLFAGLAFSEEKYLDLWRKLPADPMNEEVRRNIAITQPILWLKNPSATPCMDVLGKFTAAAVPALGPAEIEVTPGRWVTNATPAGLPGNGLAQHPMLYLGEGYNKMFVVNNGKILWTYSTGKGWEYDDAWMLSNGNILFTRMQYLAEVTPDKQVVWRYDCPTNTEVHACEPIGLDKVLFIQNGLPPKLKVVNIKTGETEVEYNLPARSLTDQKTVHAQFRRVRYTAQGTYLVPMLGLGTNGAVVEYDKNFNEVWRYAIRSPWAAIRLKNGNTLITDEADKLTREVNPKGETVWELKPEDLPEEYRFINTQSCTRLANGNTIICSRGGSGKGPQLVEVTPDKRVVWVLQDWKNLGPATAVQILDDPGVPENPGESEH
jgi:hypothetical protein